MLVTFKNRGHFCNYCRKVIYSKLSKTSHLSYSLNPVLWDIYDNHPERIHEFMQMIVNIPTESKGRDILKLVSKFDIAGYKAKEFLMKKEQKKYTNEVSFYNKTLRRVNHENDTNHRE